MVELQSAAYALRVPEILPRFYRDLQHLEDERKLARILLETGEAAPDAKTITRVMHGDGARLRGLPAVGRGISSTSPGTDPVAALLAKEARRRR